MNNLYKLAHVSTKSLKKSHNIAKPILCIAHNQSTNNVRGKNDIH